MTIGGTAVAMACALLALGATLAVVTAPQADPRSPAVAPPATVSVAVPKAATAAQPQPVWIDTFSGPAGTAPNPANWTYHVGGGGWGNKELQSYTDRRENAELDGAGHLRITVRREPYRGIDGIARQWTSARLSSQDRVQVGPGVVSARIKAPAGQGLWPAFWMLGSDIFQVDWPRSGEIDIVELLNDASVAYAGVHGATRDGDAWKIGHDTPASAPPGTWADQWHVYSVERRATGLTYRIDGRVVARIARDELPAGAVSDLLDKPMFLLLNVAVGGTWPGPPTRTTPAVATMLVDWVRIDS